MEKTLAVRTLEQAALWLELDGQLSDGMWENARPYSHWEPWCEAKVVVDPENLGRDFYAAKDNYNFSAKELLDVVQLRMLGTVRLARRFGLAVADVLEHATDCDGTLNEGDYMRKYYDEAAKLAGLGSADVFIATAKDALADTSYTLRDLRADLNELKVIVRMRRAR